MKTVDLVAAQGDVMFIRVDDVPSEAIPCPKTEKVIVARSETGHHHTISNADVVLMSMPMDALTKYLHIKAEYADVVHERSFDTHVPLRLKQGFWQIKRQREWSPDGWRIVAD